MNAKEAMKIGREVMEQMNFRFDMLILNDDDERTGLVALDEKALGRSVLLDSDGYIAFAVQSNCF